MSKISKKRKQADFDYEMLEEIAPFTDEEKIIYFDYIKACDAYVKEIAAHARRWNGNHRIMDTKIVSLYERRNEIGSI